MSDKQPAEIVRQLIECMTVGRYSDAADLYDDDARIYVMFAQPAPRVMLGKDLKARLRGTKFPRSPMYRDIECEDLRILTSDAGEIVTAEWRYKSRLPGRLEPVVNDNVIVVRVRAGKITESRDYHNHVMRAVADGVTTELLETIRQLA